MALRELVVFLVHLRTNRLRTTGNQLFVLLVLFCLVATPVFAQKKKKLKSISFVENSLEYANANQDYDYYHKKYLYLADTVILNQLVGILEKHDKLVIQISGHCNNTEADSLALQRAACVKRDLIKKGVDEERLLVKSFAATKPLISEAQIANMGLQEEIDAAHQKNRRVSFEIVRIDYLRKTD